MLTTASGKSEQRNSKMENCLPKNRFTTEEAVQKDLNMENGLPTTNPITEKAFYNT